MPTSAPSTSAGRRRRAEPGLRHRPLGPPGDRGGRRVTGHPVPTADRPRRRAIRRSSWRRRSARPRRSTGTRGDPGGRAGWRRFSRARGAGTGRTRAGTGADSVEASVLLQVGRAVPTTPWSWYSRRARDAIRARRARRLLRRLVVLHRAEVVAVPSHAAAGRPLPRGGRESPRLEEAYHAAMRLHPRPTTGCCAKAFTSSPS